MLSLSGFQLFLLLLWESSCNRLGSSFISSLALNSFGCAIMLPRIYLKRFILLLLLIFNDFNLLFNHLRNFSNKLNFDCRLNYWYFNFKWFDNFRLFNLVDRVRLNRHNNLFFFWLEIGWIFDLFFGLLLGLVLDLLLLFFLCLFALFVLLFDWRELSNKLLPITSFITILNLPRFTWIKLLFNLFRLLRLFDWLLLWNDLARSLSFQNNSWLKNRIALFPDNINCKQVLSNTEVVALTKEECLLSFEFIFSA